MFPQYDDERHVHCILYCRQCRRVIQCTIDDRKLYLASGPPLCCGERFALFRETRWEAMLHLANGAAREGAKSNQPHS
jgi:hypothetical protein